MVYQEFYNNNACEYWKDQIHYAMMCKAATHDDFHKYQELFDGSIKLYANNIVYAVMFELPMEYSFLAQTYYDQEKINCYNFFSDNPNGGSPLLALHKVLPNFINECSSSFCREMYKEFYDKVHNVAMFF